MELRKLGDQSLEIPRSDEDVIVIGQDTPSCGRVGFRLVMDRSQEIFRENAHPFRRLADPRVMFVAGCGEVIVHRALIEMRRSMPRAFELLSPKQDFLSLGF